MKHTSTAGRSKAMSERKCRRLLTVDEAPAYLDHVVKKATIRSWILKRKIDFIRLNGRIVIPSDALDAMLERGRVRAGR
jgi:excisionase family DNA binding protein